MEFRRQSYWNLAENVNVFFYRFHLTCKSKLCFEIPNRTGRELLCLLPILCHFSLLTKYSMNFSDVLLHTIGESYSEAKDLLGKLRTVLRQYGKHFEYKSTHDKQGIIYWLGTSQGTTEQYTNPVKNSLVLVSYKNLANISDSKSFFCRYETGNIQLHSKLPHNVKIIIDFSPAKVRVKPDKYTLGYYVGGNGDCILRNWKLLGSNDSKTWDDVERTQK